MFVSFIFLSVSPFKPNLSSVSTFSTSQLLLNDLLQPTLQLWVVMWDPRFGCLCIQKCSSAGQANRSLFGNGIPRCSWWPICWPLAAEVMPQRAEFNSTCLQGRPVSLGMQRWLCRLWKPLQLFQTAPRLIAIGSWWTSPHSVFCVASSSKILSGFLVGLRVCKRKKNIYICMYIS